MESLSKQYHVCKEPILWAITGALFSYSVLFAPELKIEIRI